MQKCCSCGRTMNMQMRTVIFSNKVEIERVPILTCEACRKSEIFVAVKAELTKLIRKLGKDGKQRRIHFPDVNELARVIDQAAAGESGAAGMEEMIEERVNQLLDMLILAKSLHDQTWDNEIHRKLRQISACFTLSPI